MNKIIGVFIIALFVISCEKEDTESSNKHIYPDHILAGDTSAFVSFHDRYKIENLNNGDSVPSMNSSSSSDYINYPLNFNYDQNPEIRYGYTNYLVNNYLILRNFFVSNNYANSDSIEFALNRQGLWGMGNDTLMTVKLFSNKETIDNHQRWYKCSNPDYPNVYFLSYYYDYESDNKLRFPQHAEPLKGSNISMNKTIDDKYIGIRKKTKNGYVYGFIKVSVNNFDHFKLYGYAFADKK